VREGRKKDVFGAVGMGEADADTKALALKSALKAVVEIR
jgi:hypothetical protein